MGKYKKFVLNIGMRRIYIVIDILMLFFYIVCLIILDEVTGYTKVVFNVLSNILLVGLSILTTTIISVPLITLKENNALCNRVLSEDLLSSSEFFNIVNSYKKKELLRALECNYYFNNEKEKELMYCSVRNKLNGFAAGDYVEGSLPDKPVDFYFNLCEYEIDCTLVDDYFEKRITKNLEIKSYSDSAVIENYPLINCCFSPDDKLPYCKIESLHIGSKEYSITRYVSEEDIGAIGPLEERSGYKRKKAFCFKDKLSLSSSTPVKLSICYTTRVYKNDIISTFRLRYPCKQFKFTFRTRGKIENTYDIAVNAFGFCDDGKSTPNTHTSSEVKVSFNDWIFPLDGVAVALKEKCTNQESGN